MNNQTKLSNKVDLRKEKSRKHFIGNLNLRNTWFYHMSIHNEVIYIQAMYSDSTVNNEQIKALTQQEVKSKLENTKIL